MMESQDGAPAIPRRSDAESVEHLMAAMDAAWRHDATQAVAALCRAEDALGSGFHQSRQSIERAVTAALGRDWVACWGLAHQATNTLTWHMPVHASVCPPMPDREVPGVPNPPGGCAGCSRDVSRYATFCTHCGRKVAA